MRLPGDEHERALEGWEDEGGSLAAASCSSTGAAPVPHAARLPPRYEAQPVWGFHDPSGRFSFHFHRVYGPPDELDRRGPVAVLDEERSYWAVSWTTLTATGDERPTEASISYAQARAQPGARRLTFSSFSSPSEMRAELPVLLHVAEASHPTG